MSKAVVFNSGLTIANLDEEGRQLGVNEFGAVDLDSPRVAALVDAGTLIVIPKPPKGSDVNPDVLAAFESLKAPQAVSDPEADSVPEDNEGEKSAKADSAKKTGN